MFVVTQLDGGGIWNLILICKMGKSLLLITMPHQWYFHSCPVRYQDLPLQCFLLPLRFYDHLSTFRASVSHTHTIEMICTLVTLLPAYPPNFTFPAHLFQSHQVNFLKTHFATSLTCSTIFTIPPNYRQNVNTSTWMVRHLCHASTFPALASPAQLMEMHFTCSRDFKV